MLSEAATRGILWPEACNFIKKDTLEQVFSCEFCEISKKTFFTEHSGRLLLCFIAFSDRELYVSASKPIAVRKSTAVSIIVYRNILSNFREPQVEQPKQLLPLKKPLTVKFLRLLVEFGT